MVVTISARNDVATTTTLLAWNIGAPLGATVQYVMLEAISETAGNPWTSMAEFNLLDRAGATISRTGWAVQVDSQEAATGQNSGAAALDGDAADLLAYPVQRHRRAAAAPLHRQPRRAAWHRRLQVPAAPCRDRIERHDRAVTTLHRQRRRETGR